MIDLSIQMKLIIFSLIYGFLFSILLDFLYNVIKKWKKIYKIIMSFLLVVLMTIIYFIGIKQIGYIIFHIYSVFAIIVGFFSYDVIIKTIANKNKK